LLGKHSGYLERFALYTVRKKDFTDSEINAEVIERLQEAARKRSRYGHCDTTMMVVAGFVRRKSTRGRKWILLYFECCKTRGEAMSREWHIKRDRNFRALLREAIRA
jgi:hypothetical protein